MGRHPRAVFPLPTDAGLVHLERTLVLAKALRHAGGALDGPLRQAFDFWLAHDFTSGDWRVTQLAIPRMVGEIALLSDAGLSAGAAGKVMEILARSRWADWVPDAGWVDRAGTTLLGVAYNHMLRGCLENAPSLFDAAFGRVFREIRQAKPGEDGIQTDMTFQASPGETAASGFTFVRECARFIALVHGTPWQAPPETVKLFAAFLLDGQQWMLRHAAVDPDTPADLLSATDSLDGLAAMVQQFAQLGNPPRRLELAAFTHRLQGRGEALSGHRYFWKARMSVHQRPAFYVSLRLGPPPVGDGQMRILRSGDEYGQLSAPTRVRAGTTTALGAAAGGTGNFEPVSTHWLSGGVSEGDCGLAVTEFHHPGLTGKKAWFFFDQSLVCLGTDIYGVRV